MQLAPILEYPDGTNIVLCGDVSDPRLDLISVVGGMPASYLRGKFLLDCENSRLGFPR